MDQERFLPILDEDHEQPPPESDKDATDQNSSHEEDKALSPIPPPGPLPKKRKPHMRVSFNDRVTDLATQEEYARYFEAYVTKCYTGCFNSTPACGIRVRTDTKCWVVRRPLAHLEELREMLVHHQTAKDEDEDEELIEEIPDVGATVDSTSEFVVHVLRDWKHAKAVGGEYLSALFGFANYTGGAHNYVPWLPTVEERNNRRLESKDECRCCAVQ